MNLEERIKAFAELGEIINNALIGRKESFGDRLNILIKDQHLQNPWFTPENVRNALRSIASELTEESLNKWTNAYPELKTDIDPVKVGIIMAGNIPLVGFHDFLSVLISGNNVIAKTSTKDPALIVLISEILSSINPQLRSKIEFTETVLKDFDVVIATGSNNSSRYFEYYFGKYPHIIRKNRNSIALIRGDETDTELKDLGSDIFSYFGLGCRNVSKIYLPSGYDLKAMAANWNTYESIINHYKYANNYDFNKAVFLVNKENFYDTGYLLLKEDSSLASPVSVIHYEYYLSYSDVKQQAEIEQEIIQCTVGKDFLPFGQSQSPHLWDYADGIDTLEFLLKKKYERIS